MEHSVVSSHLDSSMKTIAIHASFSLRVYHFHKKKVDPQGPKGPSTRGFFKEVGKLTKPATLASPWQPQDHG